VVDFDTFFIQAFNADPNFTGVYQVFINAWVTRMANHFRIYAITRLVALATPWNTIMANNPTPGQHIVARAQVALITQLSNEVVGLFFNSASFN
jgi:hypothetical protein